MKLYASEANKNYTGELVSGSVWSQDGVVEIPDDATSLKLVLEVFHQYSATPPVEEVKPKPVKPVKETVKEPVEAKV
jgi:hypothetical protein